MQTHTKISKYVGMITYNFVIMIFKNFSREMSIVILPTHTKICKYVGMITYNFVIMIFKKFSREMSIVILPRPLIEFLES